MIYCEVNLLSKFDVIVSALWKSSEFEVATVTLQQRSLYNIHSTA